MPSCKMPAVLVAPLTEATGNKTTAARISSLLKLVSPSLGDHVFLDSSSPSLSSGSEDCCSLTDSYGRADLIVAVHAYRSGRHLSLSHLRATSAPVVLILGGTDINHDVLGQPYGESVAAEGEAVAAEAAVPSRASIISAMVGRADAVVAFTPAMARRYEAFIRAHFSEHASDEIGRLMSKLYMIPQAVDVSVPAGAAVHPSLRASLGLPPSSKVLLLVAGIRAVKDPLYLAAAMAAWHRDDASVHWVVIGPVLQPGLVPLLEDATGCQCTVSAARSDSDASQRAAVAQPSGPSLPSRSHCGGRDGLWYHPPVPRAILLQWLGTPGDVDVLLNSSVSEGQCGAVLEAMALGVPVVVRRNEGNESVVTHGATGLLFATPQEAVSCCQSLLTPSPCLAGDEGAHGVHPVPTAQPTRLSSTGAAIVARARQHVEERHSVAVEAEAWAGMLAALELKPRR